MKPWLATLTACALTGLATHASARASDAPHAASPKATDRPAGRERTNVLSNADYPALSGSIEGGIGTRSLYGITIDTRELRVAVGPGDRFDRRLMAYGFASLMLGKTGAGLSAEHAVLGGRVDVRFSYLHGGLSLAAGVFRLHRATSAEALQNIVGVGELFAGPQVPLGEHLALSLDGTLAGELLPGHDDAVALGPGVQLRLRFY